MLHRNALAAVLQAACLRSATLPELDEEGGVFLRPLPEALNAYALPVGEGAAMAVAPLFHGMGLVTQSVNLILGQTTVMVAGFSQVRHAHRLVYSDGLDLDNAAATTPIGMGCRVCERRDCPQRAATALGRPLRIDQNAFE